jgi:hypothetical protein
MNLFRRRTWRNSRPATYRRSMPEMSRARLSSNMPGNKISRGWTVALCRLLNLRTFFRCLVRAKSAADIRKGILLLEDLYKVSSS